MNKLNFSLLILKNIIRENSISMLLEKIFIHDLLNIFIFSTLGFSGAVFQYETILQAYPYFIFLNFFSSSLSPWQSECWNKMSFYYRFNGIKVLFSRILSGVLLSSVTLTLFLFLSFLYSKNLSKDLAFIFLYALSGSITGASFGLLTELKKEKTISNCLQASVWILALGKGPLPIMKKNILMKIFPGALLTEFPLYEFFKLAFISVLFIYLVSRRDRLGFTPT